MYVNWITLFSTKFHTISIVRILGTISSVGVKIDLNAPTFRTINSSL